MNKETEVKNERHGEIIIMEDNSISTANKAKASTMQIIAVK